MDPHFSCKSPLDGEIDSFVIYLFGEKYDFYKRLGITTIFVLFLRKNKIKKKTLSVTPYLEKTVCGKPKSSPEVKLLIEKVW